MKNQHLTDCFMDVIVFVIFFLKTVANRQPSYDQVKADILRLLSQGEVPVKRGFFTQEDYETGRFAVCAWIDEAILNSSWNQRQQWQREQLQRFFYGTTEAGEEFFERLNSLGPHQREVREVFFLVLALGFQGGYCHPEDEPLLEHLKASNVKLLVGTSVGLPSLERRELFPEAYPGDFIQVRPSPRRRGFFLITVLGLAGPVILFGALFMLFRAILDSAGGKLFG
jgi:type VI secretion system protein ImpK